MSLIGKVERDVEIKSPADKFHAVISCTPHHISTMSPVTIQGCDLQKGQFGTPGAVIVWNYTDGQRMLCQLEVDERRTFSKYRTVIVWNLPDDGGAKVAKNLIEEIDYGNFSTTFKVTEGDPLKDYKQMKLTVKAKPKGEGSVVHWSFEYEKKKPESPLPNALLDLAAQCAKDIDANLITQLQCN